MSRPNPCGMICPGPIKKLAGNGIHCPTLAAVILFATSHMELQTKGSAASSSSGGPTGLQSLHTLRTSDFENDGSGLLENPVGQPAKKKAKVMKRPASSASTSRKVVTEGPRTMLEALDWPTWMVNRLADDLALNAAKVLKSTCIISHYSGGDNFTLVMKFLATSLSEKFEEKIEVPLVSQCDGDVDAQRCLVCYEDDQCVFGNTLFRLPSRIRVQASRAQPASNASPDTAAQVWQDVSHIIADSFKHDPMTNTDWCLAHGKDGRSGVAVAGSECKDFSNEGSRSVIVGKSMIPYYIWMHERIAMHKQGLETWIIHECVPLFPDHLFASFAETHHIHSVVLNPHSFGFPFHRPRKYSVLLSKKHWRLSRPMTEEAILSMFECTMHLTADDYFMAPPSESLDWLEWASSF